MTPPLVSVVIPTYNRASVVGRAVASVLTQTHTALEVIVVDDHSTDDTAQTLGLIQDPRLRVVRPERRLGGSAARNRGIDVSSGRYVAFLDDDDEWLDTKVERQLVAFAVPDPPALVYTGVWIDDGASRRYGLMKLGPEPFETLLRFPGPVTTSAFMVDRDRVNGELRFDPSVDSFNDGDLLVRISRRWPVAVVPEPLYVWHHHAGPRLSEPNGQVHARRRIIEKYADDLAVRPSTAAHLYFRLAIAESRVHNAEGIRSALLAASEADPSNRRLWALSRAARLGKASATFALNGYRLIGHLRRSFGLPDRAHGDGSI
jgi:glycosyltransferase involved in cell wall biosynthesis